MWQRLRKILIVTLFIGLVTITVTSWYVNWLSQQTNQLLLSAKDAQIELAQIKLKTAQGLVISKQSEIDTKLAELSKANQELTTKLRELDSAQKKIKAQEAQISNNASELSKLRNRPPLFNFSVKATNLTDADKKKADIERLVTDAYDVIVDVYGLPYLLHSVTIQLVDAFSNPQAAAETQISNGPDGLAIIIKLKDFDRTSFNDLNSLIHELIHTFHGLATLTPVAYEEGITVAATDVVFKQLMADGKVPNFEPLYIRTSSHGYQTSPLTIPSSDGDFYSSSDVIDYYQLAGYGWLQLYESDKQFFKKFNEIVYTNKRDGNSISQSFSLGAIERSVSSLVNGQPISSWLQTKAFALR